MLKVRQFLQADIWLGVDPFYYFEELYEIPGIPPLIYEWEIEGIKKQTAPLIETTDKLGQKVYVPDESKSVYCTVNSTGSFEDQPEGVNAEKNRSYVAYMLSCRKLDSEPTHSKLIWKAPVACLSGWPLPRPKNFSIPAAPACMARPAAPR